MCLNSASTSVLDTTPPMKDCRPTREGLNANEKGQTAVTSLPDRLGVPTCPTDFISFCVL